MWNHVNDALREATHRIVLGIGSFLPGLLALALAVVFASLLAWLLGAMVGRSLRAMDFDARLQKWGLSVLAEWSPHSSPSLLARKAVSWTVVVLGWLVGLTAFGAGVTSQLVYRAVEYMPRLGVAVLLILLGILAARFLARAVLISAVNLHIQSALLLSTAVRWLVLVFAAAMSLDHLRVGADIVRVAFAILFGGIVLAVSLAVGLGSREAVSRAWDRQGHEKPAAKEEPLSHL